MPQQQFKGYSEDQMKRIASKLGHTGDLNTFDSYLGANPKALGKYNVLKSATTQRFANGGMVKSGYSYGGAVSKMYDDPEGYLARMAGEWQDAVDYYKSELASGNMNARHTSSYNNKISGYQTRVDKANAGIAAGLTGSAALAAAGVSQADVDASKGIGNTATTANATNTATTANATNTAAETTNTNTAAATTNTNTAAATAVNTGGTATLNQAQKVAKLRADYVTQFGREIDASGLKFYSAQLAEGREYSDVFADLTWSPEGFAYHTPEEKVALSKESDDLKKLRLAYTDEFGRAIEREGFEHYSNELAKGTSIEDILSTLKESTEGKAYTSVAEQAVIDASNNTNTAVTDTTNTGATGTTNTAVTSGTGTTTGTGTGTTIGTGTGIDYNVDSGVEDITIAQHLTPALATGTQTTGVATTVNPDQLMDATQGQVGAIDPTATAGSATASGASNITTSAVNKQAATTDTAGAVKTLLDTTNAATGTVGADSQITAAEQATSAVSGLTAAQAVATVVNGAPIRNLEGNEIVNSVADAQSAAAFTEQIKAAQADPSSRATVQGQLATLMTSFDDGKTPAWAAGAMRNVTAQMASRGIGSSSMAGQALIQAALESALPIATADAQMYASFETTNLNNKQQRAMLAAQQRATFMGQEFDQAFQARVFNSTRIGEIANLNFNASQQIAIENAQIASTVNLANLSNSQANIMAEAAALSQLEMSTLSNKQQAAVQNAKSFLDMDLANMSNKQQTSLFKAQQRTAAIMSDAAAENAREQFNATSENQTDQFFKTLASQVSQFNAAQKTAVSQSNAGEDTAVSKFNAEIKNQRDQFNATNGLIINQSNAQWRRTIATADTATINRVNEINAKSLLDISNQAYNNLWQEYRDEIDWGYQLAEGEAERYNAIARATIAAEAEVAKSEGNNSASMWENIAALGLSYLQYKDGKTS